MAMKDKIFDLCNKLAQNGWKDLLLTVTNQQLDIEQASASILTEHLHDPLANIDRNMEGFEDYSLEGNQGLTAFSFSKSLLYHALASPAVVSDNLTYYPTLDDLDLVENFIFSTNVRDNFGIRTLNSLKAEFGDKLVVAVFAYQYRTWQGSSHRVHADMNYSRTGIARVGTANEIYDAQRRSFWVGEQDGEISALPCRYGTFLAVEESGRNISNDFSIMNKKNGDNSLDFLVPIHKIFEGDECFSDTPSIRIEVESYHRNEKLRRVHQNPLPNNANPGTIDIDQRYDLNAFPFFIDDNSQANFLYEKELLDGSVLIKPVPGAITQPAIQNGEYVAFDVPVINRNNRFNTSFQISAINGQRKSPEYVNIRLRVDNTAVINPDDDIVSINDLPKNEFNTLLNDGGYLAVDFIDKTADGFVKSEVISDSFRGINSRSAFSIITALDFFPGVNQRDIFDWDRGRIQGGTQFNQGGAVPMSNGRIKANIHYTDFLDDLNTMTSVLSDRSASISNTEKNNIDDSSISYLPDGASDIFLPGWDISKDSVGSTEFNAAYGLGSPFPEDAKLCAALNSFWPAAAPDASRTFFASDTFVSRLSPNSFFPKQPTAIPLTDEELGIYPRQAQALGVQSKRGWDGEFGPFLEEINNEEFVNYADIARSDYTFNAWKGFMQMDLLKRITKTQLINRMEALRSCIAALPPQGDMVTRTPLWLVSFSEIADWDNDNDKFDNQLSNNGFRFVFTATNQTSPDVDAADIKRLKMKVVWKFECQLDESLISWQETSDPQSAPETLNRATQTPPVPLFSSNT